MATNDPEFYQTPKFTAESPPSAPPERGCFFYGCIIATVLAVLVAILVAIGGYLAWRSFNQMVNEYTSTTPKDLPKLEMTPEQRKAVKDRFEGFRKAIEDGTPTESLVLTSDDINALIDDNPDFKGKIHVAIEGEKLKGQLSLPLASLGLTMFPGRYLNGEADLKASLKEGILIVTLDSFEVNGKQPDNNVMTQLRQQNLAKDAYNSPRNAEMLRKLESIEIKDGKLTIKVRPKSETAPAETKKVEPPAKAAPAEPAKTATPDTKAAAPALEPAKAATPDTKAAAPALEPAKTATPDTKAAPAPAGAPK
jgi:hypothetical protein